MSLKFYIHTDHTHRAALWELEHHPSIDIPTGYSPKSFCQGPAWLIEWEPLEGKTQALTFFFKVPQVILMVIRVQSH